MSSDIFDLPPRKTLGVDGARLSLIDAGQGEPVLLLHGYPQSLLTWRHQIGPLAQTHRVIAPDWFGWGQSERGFAHPPRYDDEVERIGALLDALDIERCNLFVHDYGAFLGLGFAGRYPERVQRLAILNSRAHRIFPPPSYALFWTLCAAGRVPGLRQLATTLPAGRLHALLMRRYVRQGCFNRELLNDYIGWMNHYAGRRWLLHFFRYYELPERPALIAGLQNIHCPVSIIWGDRDPYCPWSTAEDLARRLPQAEVTRLRGADHYVMEQRPAEVLKALQHTLDQAA